MRETQRLMGFWAFAAFVVVRVAPSCCADFIDSDYQTDNKQQMLCKDLLYYEWPFVCAK